ncbi:unnamed protein product, partial [Amoebophrya sp. A120]|eukprot:GSA120T00025966001.1
MRFAIFTSCVSAVAAFTAFNSPTAPGNYGLPAEKPEFTGEVAHSLPEVNVRYHFPAFDAASAMSSMETGLALDNRIAAAAQELRSDKALLAALTPS